VHDTVDLEARGVPSVFVATVEFIDGAVAQALLDPVQEHVAARLRDVEQPDAPPRERR